MAADIDDNLGDWSDLVSIELFTALTENLNYLVDSVPVGSIVPILVGLTGVPTPDPTLWQEARGATIEEQLSDLRDQVAPDLRDRYLKGAGTLSESGLFGGSNTKNLGHSHGGATQNFTATQIIVDYSDGFWESAQDHAHGMDTDLNFVQNWEPFHIRVKLFLKIR